MSNQIQIKEVSIEEVVKVHEDIPEFEKNHQKDHFENRYKNKDRLIIAAYVGDKPAGYIVGYNRYKDNSFYCWMAGVVPQFRQMGVLKEMMEYENNWAKEKGYDKLKIKTRNNRRGMLAYLVKYNFLFTKVVTYFDPWENRILLEKEL